MKVARTRNVVSKMIICGASGRVRSRNCGRKATKKTMLFGFSAVTALPLTGKLHQIRATLLSLGYPVVGDKLYGVDETLFLKFCEDALTGADWGRLRLRRQALHAAYLRFRHPRYGALTEAVAPLPDDMSALLPK